MTPEFRIVADGDDISARIADRLLSISVTDAPGVDSDRVEITLDNRDGKVGLQRDGATLSIALGFKGGPLWDLGRFVVDEQSGTLVGEPRKRIIRCRVGDSASDAGDGDNLLARFRETRSRSFHETTIGALVEAVASAYGLAPAIHPALRDQAVPHEDQFAETDLGFLTRVLSAYGALVKPSRGRLVVAPAGEAALGPDDQAAGLVGGVPPLVLDVRALAAERARVGIGKLSWSKKGRGKTKGTAATYRDRDNASVETISSGAPESSYQIREVFADKASAERAVASREDKEARGEWSLDVTIIARHVLAESPLELIGADEGVPQDWVVKDVNHDYSASGYTVSFSAELPGNKLKDKGDGDEA